MFEYVRQEIGYVVRGLRRAPLFLIVATGSLAIGLGANTAIISIASAVILQPPKGVAEPTSLVDVGRTRNGSGFDDQSYLTYIDVRDRTQVFSGVYAYTMEPDLMSLGGASDAEPIRGALVTTNYFATLGVTAHVGRLFGQLDDEKTGESLVVLNHRFWTRRFGSSTSIVGRTITISGHPFLVVGVTPPGFQGTTLLSPDVWVPIGMVAQAVPSRADFLNLPRNSSWVSVGARLKPRVTLEQVQADLNRVAAALSTEFPSAEHYGFRAAPVAPIPGNAAPAAGFIGLLFATTAMVLAVVCANLAGVLLARGADRRRELAVQLALGASRGRLVAHMAIETIALFMIGAAAALIVARVMLAFLVLLLPSLPVPVHVEPELDFAMIVVTAALGLGTAVLTGVLPALHSTREDIISGLKSEHAVVPERHLLRSGFVAAQVVVSVVLAIGALLFARSVRTAAHMDLGFQPDALEVATVDFSLAGYTERTGAAAARELIQRVRAMPSIESASFVRMLPLSQNVFTLGGLALPGNPPRVVQPHWNVVETGYFRTMKIRLVRGRDFDERDGVGNELVAIVNERAAQEWWPGSDPIGQTMGAIREGGRIVLTVVAVSADIVDERFGADVAPAVFVPLQQRYQPQMTLVVRPRAGQSVGSDLRSTIATFNRNLPVIGLMTFDQHAALGLAPQRIAGWVAGILGIFATGLAAVGIYGMIAYLVTSRRREIGIRLALGATPHHIATTVCGEGMRPVFLGLILGLVAAAAVGQLLSSMIFAIRAADALSFGVVTVGFLLVAASACAVPLWRALQIGPSLSLRTM